MGDPKPLASLSSGLLARKGQAAPAMRRQGMISMVPDDGLMADHMNDHNPMEDLGWNDMGHDHVDGRAGLSPMVSSAPIQLHPAKSVAVEMPVAVPEVLRQQQELVEEFAVVQTVAKEPAKPRAAAGSRSKAAFTLRLDSERHLQLRLVCALNHRSAQQVVTQALDAFLASQPIAAELSAMNSKARNFA